MTKFFDSYKQSFKDKNFISAFFSGLLLFISSLFVNFYAGIYATERASNAVTDIILSNIRFYDVDGAFVYGTIILFLFILGVCLHRPERFPFIFKSIGLFVLIRALFISLTHLGPFPTHAIIDPLSIINKFSFGADLFFSGHTGLPFLLALMFWEHTLYRYIFLFTSFTFAIVVLLGHLHYSIDVLSAFFITYTIYHISMLFFQKDYTYFQSSIKK